MPTKADPNMIDGTGNPSSHHCFSLAALRNKRDEELNTVHDQTIDQHPLHAAQKPAKLAIDCSGLSAQLALDLANCLPFLACGEESAVHAFSHSLLKDIRPEEAAQMQAIAEDELRHAHYLESLRCELPEPNIHLPVEAMSRFFRRLLTKNSARHFAQVAALDLSVCRLLAPLLHPQAGLKNAPQVREMLGVLTRDEARHVKVARNMACKLGLTPAALEEIDQEIEQRLAGLLAPIRASLDRLTSKDNHDQGELATTAQPTETIY